MQSTDGLKAVPFKAGLNRCITRPENGESGDVIRIQEYRSFLCDGGGDIVKGARAVANVMVKV